MRLAISTEALEAIRAHAEAAQPEECCGLLLGSGNVVTQVVPATNVAADPRRFFEVDPATLLRAHRSARTGGPGVLGHYHSHPSGRAIPSPRDAAAAMPDGAFWLIVAAGELRCWRAVAHGAIEGRFDEVAIAEEASGCARVPASPQGDASSPQR